MTFKKLLELIEEMSDDEKEQEVKVLLYDEFTTISMQSVLTHSDNEEELPVGTIYLA